MTHETIALLAEPQGVRPMDVRIPSVANQLPAELGLEIADAVLLVGPAGATKVVTAVAVFGAPLKHVPHEQVIRNKLAVGPVHAGVPAIDHVFVRQIDRNGCSPAS